jgi:hypothetical protein
MSDDAAPERVGVIWSPEARSDLRAIDREPAMQILYCVDRYNFFTCSCPHFRIYVCPWIYVRPWI